jgi:hypothetical protein
MGSWPALLVGPLLALADQSLAYALVGWSCANQSVAALHAVYGVSLAIALVLVFFAARDWLAAGPRVPDTAGDPVTRARFVALVAMLAGGLSAVVIFGQWIAVWMLSPCWS